MYSLWFQQVFSCINFNPHLPICGKYLNPTLKNIKIHWSHQPLLMRIPVLLWLTGHGKQKSSQETFGEFKKASKATGDTWGEDGEIVKLSPEVTLFDGSEIPFPTTGWMYKTPINNGDIYHINWCMDFFSINTYLPNQDVLFFFPSSHECNVGKTTIKNKSFQPHNKPTKSDFFPGKFRSNS